MLGGDTLICICFLFHIVRVHFGQYPGLCRNKDLGLFTCCFGGLGLVHRS